MDITNRIQSIFQSKFNVEVPEKFFYEEISLGVSGFGFTATEMLCFIDFIEKEFNIRFSAEHFTSGILRTLPGICKTLQEIKR